jgi:hypothetical protein
LRMLFRLMMAIGAMLPGKAASFPYRYEAPE